ncbi:MAG: hypothetical protein JST31_05410 [Actinobacteria bacterium]|nr:hypothetical protein [Actinomycetota bacterium]
MRKLLTLSAAVCALVALTAVGLASAAGEGPVTVQVGNLVFTANGGFTPKALSKTKQTPITLTASGSIATADGTHPPALKEVVLETDKNGEVNVKGIPTCTSGKLQSRDTKAVEAACGSAIIGEGQTTVQVLFPEQKPFNVNSKLLVVNGGFKGGTTTLYIHAYFNAPITGAIVTTVKIKKHPHGRFGLKSVATIPKIANGAGSVTSFSLKINKGIKRNGKVFNPLTAKCTDGKLQVHVLAKFASGPAAATEIIRACTPKG